MFRSAIIRQPEKTYERWQVKQVKDHKSEMGLMKFLKISLGSRRRAAAVPNVSRVVYAILHISRTPPSRVDNTYTNGWAYKYAFQSLTFSLTFSNAVNGRCNVWSVARLPRSLTFIKFFDRKPQEAETKEAGRPNPPSCILVFWVGLHFMLHCAGTLTL